MNISKPFNGQFDYGIHEYNYSLFACRISISLQERTLLHANQGWGFIILCEFPASTMKIPRADVCRERDTKNPRLLLQIVCWAKDWWINRVWRDQPTNWKRFQEPAEDRLSKDESLLFCGAFPVDKQLKSALQPQITDRRRIATWNIFGVTHNSFFKVVFSVFGWLDQLFSRDRARVFKVKLNDI